ncbi:MAG TPA: flagellar basal body-associated FliL family protein [Burkholderiales bacterium]|nr:flagellar basal body-associated FliL family protein [Burkholderiales bacterium]
MAKSPKTEAAAEEPADAPAKTGGGKKKLILIGASALLLAAGGGGGAWFFLKGKHSGEGEAQAKTVKKEVKRVDKGAPPVFLPLDSFVVNLRNPTPGSGDQFLQTDMTLRVGGADVVEEIKQHMPEVRSHVLMLLSSKTSQELLTPEGKTRLAEAVRMEITGVIDPEAVKPAAKPAIKKQEEGEKDADAKDKEEESADAAAEEAPSPEEQKVRSVLFTSFIIQ